MTSKIEKVLTVIFNGAGAIICGIACVAFAHDAIEAIKD